MPPHGRRRWRALFVVVLALAMLGGGFGLSQLVGSPSSSSDGNGLPAREETAGPTPTVDPSATEEPIAAVAAAVSPAVVQIETGDGLGSGVIYDADGYILTAAHVLDGARSAVQVRLADGSTHRGEVLGADDGSDIAVVKIDGVDGLAVANLGVDVKLVVGQTAVAVGSPFGLDQTVTAGIVSAIDRPVQTPSGAIDMIQTDAPINPGNSGGPLADRKGRIIGINDAIATDGVGESNAGVGFAIPIGTAMAVAERIVAGESVEFGYLGVTTQGSGSGLIGEGAIVVRVEPGSPAAGAGIEEGDRITAVDGAAVRDQVDLAARIRGNQPGDQVTVTLNRDGDERDIDVTLGTTKSD
ncbi:MAG: S1C family serine protease [Acidimicrobiia bacterium]